MVEQSFKILVLSDLHAVNDGSNVRGNPAMNYATGSGPRGLLGLCVDAIHEQFPGGLDLLLVAGDMTDQASGGSLSMVWADLHWLAERLSIPLVATSGNHDYDSRAAENPLPYRTLISLEPTFPFGSVDTRNKYIAEQHAVYTDQSVVVVSANSAAHHGYTSHGSPEHAYGRFSDVLPSLMRKSLDEIGVLPAIKVLLTHHHLNQLPSFDVDEHSASIGHEDVLRTLSEYGDWLVVHGHKHRGWVQFASGGGDAQPLISSASFSADLGGGTFAEKVRHQFHVVEVEMPDLDNLEGITGASGVITSWTHSRLGWALADAQDDMPGKGGFGWKTNVRRLAELVRTELADRLVMTSGELLEFEPRLRYLSFDDRRRLVTGLQAGSPKVRAVLLPHGSIQELSIVQGASR